MLSKQIRICFAAAITSAAFLSTPTLSAGNDGSMKGKPFVVLNDEIITVTGVTTDLQDQIDALVAKVDTIEERVGANETAISDLQINSSFLEAMILANATSVTDIENVITNLQSDVANLQTQINYATGDISYLQSQVLANEALIVNLQGALLALQQGSIVADNNLQAQIDTNTNMILALQDEIRIINDTLTMKQNITAGVCPNGEAVIAVWNGGITCDATPAGITSVTQYRTYAQALISANRKQALEVECPAGFIATGGGGGFYPSGLHWTSSMNQAGEFRTDVQGWFVVNLSSDMENTLTAHVTCLRFNQ